jgi:hypothetical protein
MADRIGWFDMGVDFDHLSLALDLPYPFERSGPGLAFVGNVGYQSMSMPLGGLHANCRPGRRRIGQDCGFGSSANPTPDALLLATLTGERVTGRIADARPYLAHATVAMTPVRIACSVQTKVLEAMAMEHPVIALFQAFEGLHVIAGRDLLTADGTTSVLAPTDDSHLTLVQRHRHLGWMHDHWSMPGPVASPTQGIVGPGRNTRTTPGGAGVLQGSRAGLSAAGRAAVERISAWVTTRAAATEPTPAHVPLTAVAEHAA